MTDLVEWRQEVLAVREASRSGDAYAQLSATGLVQFFNSCVPSEYQISITGAARAVVSGFSEPLTGRVLALVLDHFTRAVASIGQEIHDPTAARQLGPADYARAPIFPSTVPGGPLVLATDRSDLAFGAVSVGPTTSQQALARLANLLPERSDDSHFASRLLAAREPTARALNQVALAAKKTGGLRVMLDGGTESVSSTVDVEQADMIAELLRDSRESVQRQRVSGRLDGVRFRRREFYLDVDGRDIHGVVDESLVETVRALLDQDVQAEVERVQWVSGAGVHQQPTYRLVALAPVSSLFD